MLGICGNNVGLAKEPIAVHATTAMDNETRLSLQRTEKIESLSIGRRQCARRMLAIGKVEVEPRPRHNIRCRVFTTLELARVAGRPLQSNTEVDAVFLGEALACASDFLPG